MTDIYINNAKVLLDKKTAIAINRVNFDITDISNRRVDYTNDFQIPVAGNEHIFGFCSLPSSTSTVPYEDFDVKIVSGPFTILSDGRGWITSISGGYYNITVTQKSGFINDMKDYSLSVEKTTTYTVSTDSLTKQLVNGTGGSYKIDFLFNDFQYDYVFANTDKYYADYENHHLSKYVKKIFTEFANDSGYTFTGGLYTDAYFEDLRVLCYGHTFKDNVVSGIADRVYQAYVSETLTFYDLFREVMKIFCATFTISGTTITLEKLDSLDWSSPVDWSGKLLRVNNKLFHIPGTGQNNYIRFNTEDEAAQNLNQVNIACNNLNIDYEKELIKMNSSVYPFVAIYGLYSGLTNNEKAINVNVEKKSKINGASFFTLDINTYKSIDKFVFICDGAESMASGVDVRLDFHTGGTYPFTKSFEVYTTAAGDNRAIATYYNSVNDYIRVAAMLQNPVFYEVTMNLTLIDIKQFDQQNLVRIPELGGNFYVNSIKNYLLNSNQMTADVELIKVNE